MAKEFKIGELNISFPFDIEEFNDLRTVFLQRKQKAVEKFANNLSQCKNIDEIIQYAGDYAKASIKELYGSFESEYINRGDYGFDSNDILTGEDFEELFDPFCRGIEPLLVAKQKASDLKQGEKDRREFRKATRTQMIGGGFGVGGALKGMATAGAFNAVSGLAHSTWNMVGNAMTSFEASGIEDKAFKESFDGIISGFKATADNVLGVLVDELEIDIDFDGTTAENICKNLTKGIIRDENVDQAFTEAIIANPYLSGLYSFYINKHPELEQEVLDMSKHFNVDMSDYYGLDGYVFSSMVSLQQAKAARKELYALLNKKTFDGFAEKIHSEPVLMNKRLLVYTNYVLKVYKSYISDRKFDNKDVLAFFEYNVSVFEEVKENIIKQAKNEGYTIGKLSLAEDPSDIAMILAKAEYNKTSDKFYYTDILPQAKYDEFIENGINEEESYKDNKDAQVYVFYDGSLESFLLTEDGYSYIQTKLVKFLPKIYKRHFPMKTIGKVEFKYDPISSDMIVNTHKLTFLTEVDELKHATAVIKEITSKLGGGTEEWVEPVEKKEEKKSSGGGFGSKLKGFFGF